jgi:hypothetical protein
MRHGIVASAYNPPAGGISAVKFATGQSYSTPATGLVGNNVSWCAWAKLLASTSNYSTIIASSQSGGDYNQMGTNSTGTQYGRIMTGGDNALVGAVFTPGVWTFCAVVHDLAGTDMMYFFPAGGSLLSQNASESTNDGFQDICSFTIADWAFSGRWDGSIACVRVWRAVLTQAELLIEKDKAVAQRTANLWAVYNFTSGPQTVDNSGNGRTLTATGTPTTDASGPPVT